MISSLTQAHSISMVITVTMIISHTSQYTDYAPSSRICYDLNALYQLNRQPYQLLSQPVWTRVCELGIGRRRQTHRGLRRRVPRSQYSAPTCISVPSTGLQLGLWNARYLTNKSHAVTDLVVDNNLDVLVITESWLSGDSNRDGHTLADLKSCFPTMILFIDPVSLLGVVAFLSFIDPQLVVL